MCGIVGIVTSLDSSRVIRKDNLVAMRDTMLHRGPDDEGIYIDNNCGLGHRRLAILDLSSLGRQPMEFNNWIITFNGEIFNYQEVRQELKKLGHKFKSQTDTEVILHAFDEWGQKCVEKFNGMFAFGIYNKKTKNLFLVRDRLGVKPLYYYIHNQKTLVFASEIRAICKFSYHKADLNKEALFDFFRYSFVPGEDTLLKDIKELLPGHILSFNNLSGTPKIKINQYWNLPEKENNDSFEEASAKVEELLKDSVKIRLISDVPVGVQLSGGIDSTMISTYAKEFSPKINAISVDTINKEFSEKIYASFVARKLKIPIHYIPLNFPDFYREIDRLSQIYGEPVVHPNTIGIYLLSRQAKQHATVLLSGEGSDELFCGYDRYRQVKMYNVIANIPSKKLRKRVAERYLPNCFYNFLVAEQKRSFGNYYVKNVYHSITNAELRNVFRKNIPLDTENEYLVRILKENNKFDLINRASRYDLKNYLVSLLHRQDRASMAFGIENRVPFLDYRLVEYVSTLPSKYKLKGPIAKYILKNICNKYYPKKFVYRPKMGFAMPVAEWLRTNEGSKMLDTLLDKKSTSRGIFEQDYIKDLIESFKNPEGNANFNLTWILLMFEKWARVYLDGESID